jgi:integrase
VTADGWSHVILDGKLSTRNGVDRSPCRRAEGYRRPSGDRGVDGSVARQLPRLRPRRHPLRLCWLIALRGLRRGEAAGLRWVDIDLHEGQLSVVRQRTTAGYAVQDGPPKWAASRRQVALDKHTVQVLRQQRERQQQRRAGRLGAGSVS